MRAAIDVAKLKSKHSEFWYKLENLNDKLMIFKMLFYSKMPHHQKVFYEKKKAEMDERMQQEQAKYEKEMAKLAHKKKKTHEDQYEYIVNTGSGISCLQMMKDIRQKNKGMDPTKIKLPKNLRKVKSRINQSLLNDS